MLTMAPIAQPYSQEACGIGYGAFSALGWAESRFEIDFLVRLMSNDNGEFKIFIGYYTVYVLTVYTDTPAEHTRRPWLKHN
jgi:hypothetical protein